MNKNISKTTTKFDYIRIVSCIDHLELDNEDHVNIVRTTCEELGLKEIILKQGYLFKNQMMRIYLGKNPLQKDKLFLTTDLPGEFCSLMDDEWSEAKKIYDKVYTLNGFIGHITRVDIRTDLMSKGKYCRNIFNTFPRVNDPKKVKMIARGKNEIKDQASYLYTQYHNDKYCLSKPTGFSIYRENFRLISYNRRISLEDKKDKGKISKELYNHFRQVYRPYDSIQRIELKLKHSSQISLKKFCFVSLFYH